MKLIFKIIKFAFFALVLALIFHNFTAKFLLKIYLENQLGVPVEVEKAKVDFFTTKVTYEGIVIKNPGEFPSGEAARISYADIDFEVGSWKDFWIYFDEVNLEFQNIEVLRIPGKKINIYNFKNLREPVEPAASLGPDGLPPRWNVNKLVLTLRYARLIDLTSSNPKQTDYDLKTDHVAFQNPGTLREVVSIAALEAGKKMGL